MKRIMNNPGNSGRSIFWGLIITFLVILMNMQLQAQTTIESVLSEVEKNNTTLAAYRQQMEADKQGNRTGIFPHNPEFEYAYQWGDPVSIGLKKNISFRQSFDFPTAYSHMNKLSRVRDAQLETVYRSQRKDILLEACLTAINLVHANKVQEEMSLRLRHAVELARAYERMLDAGEISLIELHKVRLNLTVAEQQLARTEAEREKYQADLQRLNGNLPIEVTHNHFDFFSLPENFDAWLAELILNNPELQWLQQELSINLLQQRLAKARSLPSISAGYVSEDLTHEQFRGWAVGVTIPLWEQKNTVKLARAQSLATEQMYADQQMQFEVQLNTLYDHAVNLRGMTNRLQQGIAESDNLSLVETAWQQGEINLLEYLLELSFLYQATDQLLDAEKELAVTLALLRQFEL